MASRAQVSDTPQKNSSSRLVMVMELAEPALEDPGIGAIERGRRFVSKWNGWNGPRVGMRQRRGHRDVSVSESQLPRTDPG